MGLRLEYTCKLISDEWAKILQVLSKEIAYDIVPMSQAINILTKIQFVMSKKLTEEEAFEVKKGKLEISTDIEDETDFRPKSYLSQGLKEQLFDTPTSGLFNDNS